MPPSIDLQRFRDELEQLYLTEGYTHQQLAHWLADRGLVVAPRTLKRRLKNWGLTRRKAAGTPTALETISDLFHTTTADDDTIAHTLAVQGTAISTRQVKEARLSSCCR
jgi:Clr5 domain